MSHSGRTWTQQHQEQLTMSLGRCLAVASSTQIPSDAKSVSEFPLVCRDGIRCPPPGLSDQGMKQGQLEGRQGRAAQDGRSAAAEGLTVQEALPSRGLSTARNSCRSRAQSCLPGRGTGEVLRQRYLLGNTVKSGGAPSFPVAHRWWLAKGNREGYPTEEVAHSQNHP